VRWFHAAPPQGCGCGYWKSIASSPPGDPGGDDALDERVIVVFELAGVDVRCTHDGKRLLVNLAVEQRTSAPITLVINWTADLKR
jgi:hypothetical protein